MLQLYKWALLVSLILYLCHNQHLRFNPMIHMSSYSYPNEVHSHTELGFGWPRDTRCDSVWIPKLGHKTSINTSISFSWIIHSGGSQPRHYESRQAILGWCPRWMASMLRSLSYNQYRCASHMCDPCGSFNRSQTFWSLKAQWTADREHLWETLARNTWPSIPEPLTFNNSAK